MDPPLPEHGSPPTPASSSLLLPALPVTLAVPSPGPLRPSPSSRRARGQGTGLVTSFTAELSTEWTPASPTNPRHCPRPRAPGSALRPRLAGPRPPGSPRSPLTAALRPCPLRRGKSGPVRGATVGPREGLRPGWGAVPTAPAPAGPSVDRASQSRSGWFSRTQWPRRGTRAPGRAWAARFCFGETRARLVRFLPRARNCVSQRGLGHPKRVAEVAPGSE